MSCSVEAPHKNTVAAFAAPVGLGKPAPSSARAVVPKAAGRAAVATAPVDPAAVVERDRTA